MFPWSILPCELRPPRILNVLIWPSEQFEFKTFGLQGVFDELEIQTVYHCFMKINCQSGVLQ